MADNLGYTPGSGATVSTEEVTTLNGSAVTAQHMQRMAVGISTANGVGIDLPGDATNGLDVDVTRVSGRVQVGDASNPVAIDTAPTDAESNTANLLYTAGRLFVFNGTTWDRARGDITNGLDVDVTRVSGNVTVVQSTASNLKADANITNASITVAQATAGNLNATVTGTVTANAGTGNFTVTQATAANLNATATLAAGTAYAGRIRITDGTNDLSVDTVHNDGESSTENHLDVAAKTMGYNGTTWDMVRSTVQTYKAVQATTAQTGVAIWTPAAGKAVVVTAMQIQSYGTTAGTAIVWFGAVGNTTFSRNTTPAIFDGEFAPSATNKPGVYTTFPVGMRGPVDNVLRYTTTNAQSITITVWGYEI